MHKLAFERLLIRCSHVEHNRGQSTVKARRLTGHGASGDATTGHQYWTTSSTLHYSTSL